MFYEIYSDGEPTGMGSTNMAEALALGADYVKIYGGRVEIKESPTHAQ